MTDKEYNEILKQYHKLSDRHILVVETDMPVRQKFTANMVGWTAW